MKILLLTLLPMTAWADYDFEYRVNGPATGISQIQSEFVDWSTTGNPGDVLEARVRECISGVSCSAYTPWMATTLVAQAQPGQTDFSVTATTADATEAQAQTECNRMIANAEPGTGTCNYTVKEISVVEKTGTVTK